MSDVLQKLAERIKAGYFRVSGAPYHEVWLSDAEVAAIEQAAASSPVGGTVTVNVEALAKSIAKVAGFAEGWGIYVDLVHAHAASPVVAPEVVAPTYRERLNAWLQEWGADYEHIAGLANERAVLMAFADHLDSASQGDGEGK